ncbi:MAG: hypothetical protein L0Y68_04400 [Candidatus Dadabacteria bacterium]|nr:hypothetical protein [Candidatus Dadabacteria bacterium]
MNTDDLLDAFGEMLADYTEFPVIEAKKLLKQNLAKRKDFDTQDEAIIEALIKDKDKLLEKSFIEEVEDYLKKQETDEERSDFLRSKEGQDKIIEIFLSVLEKLVDYYYQVLLNKQFGGL